MALAPLHILALGDLQYENGSLTRFQRSYGPSWGRFKSITKPVPGNHEYGSGGQDFDADAPGYFTYFEPELATEGPDAGNCAAGLAPEVSWEGGCAVGSEQERWLQLVVGTGERASSSAARHGPLRARSSRTRSMECSS